MDVFTQEERDSVRDQILELARSDGRVVAAAVVGSLAGGGGDPWSDIDLSFAVRDEVAINEVLDEWSVVVSEQLAGVRLLDLVAGPLLYRVFLLPRCLQLDLSLAPASLFRPTSPRFRLLYGEAGEPVEATSASADHLLGWAALYARDVRVSIERRHLWRAENSLSALRHYALSFACSRRGLPATYGKGHDQLPEEVLDSFAGSLASSVEPYELKRALNEAVTALRAECARAERVSHRLDQYLTQIAPA